MRLFSYVVARDFGFAPNPFHGVCTLATCMPTIRESAALGDWIVGTGSRQYKAKDIEGKLTFCMQVAEIIEFDRYWRDERFEVKKPVMNASLKYRMGDNIYHQENGRWRQENSHHSCADGSVNPNNLRIDTKRTENVLVGSRFAYWGRDAFPIPERFRDFEGFDVVKSGRGYKCNLPDDLVISFVEWFESLGLQGIQGEPAKFQI